MRSAMKPDAKRLKMPKPSISDSISALFGLFQGGIVPSYAIIVREYFPPQEAGMRVGVVLTSTLIGMAFGGWISGAIHDFAESYQAAFINGVAWNLINIAIAAGLIWRTRQPRGKLVPKLATRTA